MAKAGGASEESEEACEGLETVRTAVGGSFEAREEVVT